MLRKRFRRLTKEQIKFITEILAYDKNIKTCDACREHLFGPCEQCNFSDGLLKNMLIESYIPVVLHIAKKLGGRKYFEVQSVGLYSLTKAVNNLPTDLKSLDAYLWVYITREIKRFLILDTTIKVPCHGSATHRHLRSTFSITDYICTQGGQDAVDLNELLSGLPKTQNEEIVLKCLVEGGYSIGDMAAKCKLGKPRISQIKGEVVDRLLKKLRAAK